MSLENVNNSDWMSADQVAQMLGVTKRTVLSLAKRDQLKRYRLGASRIVRYKRSEVEQQFNII